MTVILPDKNVVYTREYQEHRREYDSVFESPGERQKTIVLAQEKYFVDVSHHRQRKIFKNSEEELNLAVARLIVRDGENNMIAEIKSIDDHDYIGLVEHRNGQDYLVYRIDLYGYSVMEIETGKTVDYIPESSFTGGEETFIWVDTKYCPVNNLLVVDGCYWACPYGFEFYDFSNPMELPLPLFGNSYGIERKMNIDIAAGVENVEFDENGNCCMKIENSDQTIAINPCRLTALYDEK